MNNTPAPTVWPSLQARDCPALIDFLLEAFGFIKTAVYADGDQVAHAQLDWPEGGGIMLGSYQPDREWTREPGTFGGYVVTDHAGATIVREPAGQDYGNYDFTAADPEGNLWSFGSYRGEPRG